MSSGSTAKALLIRCTVIAPFPFPSHGAVLEMIDKANITLAAEQFDPRTASHLLPLIDNNVLVAEYIFDDRVFD